MTVRAKMRLVSETIHAYNTDVKRLRFETVYDQSIPEDAAFCKATPSGHFEMQVDNPSALAQLRLGDSYYVDFTPVPEPAPAA